MNKTHLSPSIIIFLALLLLLGSMGCSAAQASPQIVYVTVTPSVDKADEANPPLHIEDIHVVSVENFLTPLPTVDYLATSIAGSTATVVRAIEINNYQTGRREGEQGGGGDNLPTALPTGTPAHQPTGTPAHQPTRTPASTGAAVSIQSAQFTNCESQTTDLSVSGANNLQGFAFKLRFDPNIVQVIDADPDQDGTQISLSGDFRSKQHFIAVNQVDQISGLIDFAAVMIGEANVNGKSVLAQINWMPRQSGRADLTLEHLVGQAVSLPKQTS